MQAQNVYHSLAPLITKLPSHTQPWPSFHILKTCDDTQKEAKALELLDGEQVHACEGFSLACGNPLALFLGIFSAA